MVMRKQQDESSGAQDDAARDRNRIVVIRRICLRQGRRPDIRLAVGQAERSGFQDQFVGSGIERNEGTREEDFTGLEY